MSSSVLQGFTCTRVRTIKRGQINKLIKACRRRGRNRVKLVETQVLVHLIYQFFHVNIFSPAEWSSNRSARRTDDDFMLVSLTADLHVQLHQSRSRCHQLRPLSSRRAAVLRVSFESFELETIRAVLFFFFLIKSLRLLSYSLVPQASCRFYFQQLADADFSVFSTDLSYKRNDLFTNCRSCLVSPPNTHTNISNWHLHNRSIMEMIMVS